MQQSLVLLVSHAELLQEQVSVPDDLLHLHIILQTQTETRELKSPPRFNSQAQRIRPAAFILSTGAALNDYIDNQVFF